MLDMYTKVARMMTNPFVLMIISAISMMIRGGFLGLILCAFLKKNPDIFANAVPSISEQDEPENE